MWSSDLKLSWQMLHSDWPVNFNLKKQNKTLKLDFWLRKSKELHQPLIIQHGCSVHQQHWKLERYVVHRNFSLICVSFKQLYKQYRPLLSVDMLLWCLHAPHTALLSKVIIKIGWHGQSKYYSTRSTQFWRYAALDPPCLEKSFTNLLISMLLDLFPVCLIKKHINTDINV